MTWTLPVRALAAAALATLVLTGCPGTGRPGAAPSAGAASASPLLAAAAAMPAPLLGFDGVGQGFVGPAGTFAVTVLPPSPVGAVGPSHYVQAVNSSLAVFNKGGSPLLGPVPLTSLFTGAGGQCAASDDGSPKVVYDRLADRWVVSYLSMTGGAFLDCVAVSKTADPTGAWFTYAFAFVGFVDRPRMGLWPDAYYVAVNAYNAAGTAYLGPRICALDRASMLAGNPATMQCFTLATSYGDLLPADLDGSIPPPAGAPNTVASIVSPTVLGVWKFHVDWVTPANSTFTGPTSLPITTYGVPCGGYGINCIPQLGTTGRLEHLTDSLASRLPYRHFPDGRQSLVAAHSIGSGSGVELRWYELSIDGFGVPSIVQEGTHAPDATFRWNSAIAQDQSGNVALGYSTSSATIKPSIALAGRLAADPGGQLSLAEITILAGAGAQTGAQPRWGDVSTMSLDPVDGCTFWYTNEYLPADGSFNWRTRIATFALPGCAPPDFSVAAAPAALTVQPGTSATSAVSTAVTAGAATAVAFTTAVAPAGAGVTAGLDTASTISGGGATLTVTASPQAAAGSYTVTVTGTGSGKSHAVTVTVTVTAPPPPPPDFTIAAAPAALTVQQGTTATSTVSTTSVNGAGTVGLTATLAPMSAEVTAVVAPASIASGGNATLTVGATAAAAPGSYTVTVTGAEGGLSHAATVTVTVTAPPPPPPPPPDFTIAAAPAALAVQQGTTATSTVSTTSVNGAGAIGLTAAVSPATAEVNPLLTPGSIPAGATATLSVTATAAATPGSYTVTVTGTGGSATHATTVAVTVTAAPARPAAHQGGGCSSSGGEPSGLVALGLLLLALRRTWRRPPGAAW